MEARQESTRQDLALSQRGGRGEAEANSPVWGLRSWVDGRAKPEVGALGEKEACEESSVGMLSVMCPDGKSSRVLSEALEQEQGQRVDLSSSESPGQGGPERALGYWPTGQSKAGLRGGGQPEYGI